MFKFSESINLIAIDPGPEESAVIRILKGKIETIQILRNPAVENLLKFFSHPSPHLIIEKIESYGRIVGQSIFDTVRAIARFEMLWDEQMGEISLITRREVCQYLCGHPHPKNADSAVKNAIYQLFEIDPKNKEGKHCSRCRGTGQLLKLSDSLCPKCEGSGWERQPSILTGIRDHSWSALALCVYYQGQLYGKTWVRIIS